MTIKEIYKIVQDELIKDVFEACLTYNGSITSWGRTVERNRNKGGHRHSWHLDWLAFDVAIDDKNNRILFKTELKEKGKRVLESNSGAYHIQYDWPVYNDFRRENIYTHLKVILEKYPQILNKFAK